MATIRDFTLLAALALGGAAYAQAPASQQTTPPTTPPGQENPTLSHGYSSSSMAPDQEMSPNAAAGEHQREVTPQPGTESPMQTNPNPSAASTPHPQEGTRLAEAGVASGMAVQSESGRPLGFVVDVLPGAGGAQENGYVVIAGSSGGGATPVPYSTASSMVRNGKLVIDRRQFEHAPRVQQNQLEDQSAWKDRTDSYWMHVHGHMGMGEHMGSEEHMSPDQPMHPTAPPQPGQPQSDQTLPPR